MKNMMGIIIIAVIYLLYVFLGIYRQFPVGYLDWVKPYTHLDVIAQGSAFNALALPVLVIIGAGFGWYRRSMIGDP